MGKLVLGSNSPRRKQLLEEAGYHFDLIKYDFDETIPKGLSPIESAEHLARDKNKNYRSHLKDEILITADTIVVAEDKMMGKPENHKQAYEMLQTLSGKSHHVISGVSISDPQKGHTFSDITHVTFDTLSDEEINFYIRKFSPFDKAGAYGIQDWIGLTKITQIEGSYFNVMGLPTQLVYTVLKDKFDITPY